MWNGSIFFWRFLILMKWVSPSFPTIWVLRKLLDFSLNSTLPLFFLVVCWWKIIRRRFFGLFFVYMILWGLLIAGLLQSDYLFPFSLLYSPKPLHEPRVSLSTKELQTQSSAFQTLTQPHFASHKIPYQLRQRKKKKKTWTQMREEQRRWSTSNFSHLSLPLHLKSKPTTATTTS